MGNYGVNIRFFRYPDMEVNDIISFTATGLSYEEGNVLLAALQDQLYRTFRDMMRSRDHRTGAEPRIVQYPNGGDDAAEEKESRRGSRQHHRATAGETESGASDGRSTDGQGGAGGSSGASDERC
jgi:hypothetical protein